MSLRFLAEVEKEYLNALRYYREVEVELATDLMAVDEHIALVERFPDIGRIESAAPPRFELRWHRLRRFPHSLLVGLIDGERVVVAFAHHRQRPGRWLDRIE